MVEVKLNQQSDQPGSFDIYDQGIKVGEMIFDIQDKDLTVYHTEIDPEHDGKGYAKMLLETMVNYVRANGLMVIPMCPYVHAQFKRHPELYSDIWNRKNEN